MRGDANPKGYRAEHVPGPSEYVTTWRALGTPAKPGVVQTERRRGTVCITQAHVDYAQRECDGFCIVVLVPAADSTEAQPRWNIGTIGGHSFLEEPEPGLDRLGEESVR